ncbi:MAG: HAD-IC family P-type ATPase, partial [Ardenticatenaceae bacterium]
PLAAAIRREAARRKLSLSEPEAFEAIPGKGIRATVDGATVEVGSHRLLRHAPNDSLALAFEEQGKTSLWVTHEGQVAGLLAAADAVRPEVPGALEAVKQEGIRHIVLLTGDNERAAAALAGALRIPYRANLLPEDKIAIVKEWQARGHTVVMVGDGVNDAPALAQADVGIAMGAAGIAIAMEAAHIVILREDWSLVPEALRLARRTMGVVRMNLAFTALYNLAGLSLAALGLLPPIVAAAAQSLPDLGILANSSRLLRPKPGASNARPRYPTPAQSSPTPAPRP